MSTTDKSSKAYQAYVTKGRVSRMQINLLCGIGVFIFGWLQVIAFQKLGRGGLGWAFLAPIIFCFSLGRQGNNPAFFVIGGLIYLVGWVTANLILNTYQKLDQATTDQPVSEPAVEVTANERS